MAKQKMKSVLVDQWKKYTMTLVKRRFGNSISDRKLEEYLDRMINTEMKVPTCHLVNNFKQIVMSSDALAAINSIEESDLIVGGASTLFVQHNVMKNPMRSFIISKQKKRKAEKKARDQYEAGTDEWETLDNAQSNTKVIINSLYGVLGYAKFILHNIFMAEGVTRMGRVIISTAACGFENFLADNVQLSVESEVYEYINLILDEYDEKYKDKMNFGILGEVKTTEEVVNRLIDKCCFPVPASLRAHITAIVNRQDDGAKLILYYKNNFLQFNRIPLIKNKIMNIIASIDELKVPNIDHIKDEHTRSEIDDLWKFYEAFVFYCHPIYDSVRKMAYQSRKAVLYIDTDSNFISLSRWVKQIQHEFFQDQYAQDPKEMTFICANIITIFLSTVVDRNLKMYAANCHITPEWATFLSMKNEFFFWRILFGDVKKRYVDLKMIQEGKLLNDGDGLVEIKGYDFRKSTTKESVRSFYTSICNDKILVPNEINLKSILMDIDGLKKELRISMTAGESKYYKQANVASPDHYADPFRISGIKGVMLWNALMPEYAIALPSDVDLIPIKNLSTKKNREWFSAKYPGVYAKLEREIFNNRNEKIATMSLSVIAKPKDLSIPIPDWMQDIMDTAKIINNTVKLFNPIMESLGMKVQRPTSAKEFLVNIVDL